MGAIMSTPHLVMKFPSVSRDILTVHVDQKVARECYVASLRAKPTNRVVVERVGDAHKNKRLRNKALGPYDKNTQLPWLT